jgi:hypothetical protein
MRRDLRGCLFDANCLTKINRQDKRWLARFWEWLCCEDSTNPDIDFEEVVESDGARNGRSGIVGVVHGAFLAATSLIEQWDVRPKGNRIKLKR